MPEGYCSIGVFSTTDARFVLQHFEKNSLRFQVRCDTKGPPINIEGMNTDDPTTEVYAHPADTTAARKIVDDWRISIGRV